MISKQKPGLVFGIIFILSITTKSDLTNISIKTGFNNYLHNLHNILDWEYQKPIYTIGLFTIPASFALDNSLNSYTKNHTFYSNKTSSIGDFYGHRWGYYLTLSSLFLSGPARGRTRDETIEDAGLFIETILTTAAITEILKLSINRHRPIGYGADSFPSGHTSGSFALATLINHFYGKTAGYCAYGMAGFVATTRINDRKHYLSDVVVGALIGTVVGRSFTKNSDKVTISLTPFENTIKLRLHYSL